MNKAASLPWHRGAFWHRLSQKRLMLFFTGMVGAFGWAPYHQPAFFLIILNALMIRLWFCSTIRQALRCGWWWGWGFYVGNIFWIGNSLLVDARRFAWALPFSLAGLPGIFALYPCLIAGVLAWARPYCTPLRYAGLFCLLWSLMEIAQGHLLTGFPWTLVAYIWDAHLPLAQYAAFLGSYGLGLMTLLIACLPTAWVMQHFSFKSALQAAAVTFSLLAGAYGGGYWRLANTFTMFHPHICLRLVQPFLPQKEKDDPAYAVPHFSTLITCSHARSAYKPTHVIWPEAAIPWMLSPALLSQFPPLAQDWVLLTGGIYETPDHHLTNSLLVQYPGADLRPVYAKSHLVPFGEYFPGRSLLQPWLPAAWLQKITPGNRDFWPAPPSYVTHIPSLPPFRALICYEVIFPGTLTHPRSERPEWILSLTNDGWFGYSPGPYQHLAIARFRAIEEGLPLVRISDPGISAIIDPLGRILHSLPLNQQGFIDGLLPKPLPPTPYARFQQKIWAVLWGSLAFCFLLSFIHRPRHDVA